MKIGDKVIWIVVGRVIVIEYGCEIVKFVPSIHNDENSPPKYIVIKLENGIETEQSPQYIKADNQENRTTIKYFLNQIDSIENLRQNTKQCFYQACQQMR